MTTRAHLADGSTFDIDENTEGKFTHLDGVPVTSWEFVGETPEGWKRDESGNAPGAAKTEPEPEPEAEAAAEPEAETTAGTK